jgi:hypothetical protein
VNEQKENKVPGLSAFPCGTLLRGEDPKVPGLGPNARDIAPLLKRVSKQMVLMAYKERSSCLWMAFIGGTGTGKSTLFNALSGKQLSRTGVERPTTIGSIAYAHRECAIERGFPLGVMEVIRRDSRDPDARPAAGHPGQLLVMEHDRENWSHLILVDTPDLDSVEEINRENAEDLYALSDVVVFVTSQEKYADEVPHLFFQKIVRDHKPCHLVLNKADANTTAGDLVKILEGREISFSDERIWVIPYSATRTPEGISASIPFRELTSSIFIEADKERLNPILDLSRTRLSLELEAALSRLLGLLDAETREAGEWSHRLDALAQKIAEDFLAAQKERYTQQSQQYLGEEVRRLFARYDLLAGPRRFIKEILLSPLRLLGLLGKEAPAMNTDLIQRVRQNMDLSPLQTALMRFNRLVLEELSPPDEGSPLFQSLRQPQVALTEDEVKTLAWDIQAHLASWLESRFKSLSRRMPLTKKWGIYSTSVLWGILILSFQVVAGGGFTFLDAALDSVLAPFVTKGAVELFAYQEVRSIARELAKRYQEGLLSVVHQQRDRYQKCLQSLMPSEEFLRELREAQDSLEKRRRRPAPTHRLY